MGVMLRNVLETTEMIIFVVISFSNLYVSIHDLSVIIRGFASTVKSELANVLGTLRYAYICEYVKTTTCHYKILWLYLGSQQLQCQAYLALCSRKRLTTCGLIFPGISLFST